MTRRGCEVTAAISRGRACGIHDYDCDQSVNLTDFAAWSDCMTGPRDVHGLAPAAPTGPAVQSTIDIRQSFARPSTTTPMAA